MLRGQFKSQLSQFIHSAHSYEVVYSTSQVPSRLQKILILDSSFNPPHLGHYSLVKKSLGYSYNGSTMDAQEVSVLLLLSVKNADKVIPQPAAFEDRLDMMRLLADHIQKELNVTVSVGLTKHAKFVDKSRDIQQWLKGITKTVQNELKLTFLVGFDTLIRIFNGKYYIPYTLEQALSDFMVNNELFCLTRSDDKEYTLQDQLKYIRDIQEGKIDSVPQSWANSVFLDHGDDAVLAISSSAIRRSITKDHWFGDVIDNVREYIQQNGIYKL